MLKIKVTESGRIKLDDINKKLIKLSNRLKRSEINSMLMEFSDDIIEDVKKFFLDREYKKLGKIYTSLTEKWEKRKIVKTLNYFYVNTQDFLNSLYSKVTRGTLSVEIPENMTERYNRLSDMRPIVSDNSDYIVRKILKKIEDRLKKFGI